METIPSGDASASPSTCSLGPAGHVICPEPPVLPGLKNFEAEILNYWSMVQRVLVLFRVESAAPSRCQSSDTQDQVSPSYCLLLPYLKVAHFNKECLC